MKKKLLSILALLCLTVSSAWAGTQATGYFESCTAYHGSIRVKGWAYDPDQPATSIQVHAYIWYGPTVGTTQEERMPAVGINANIERSDVNEAKGITGAHGFDQYIAVPAGTYTVQVFAIDKTGDGNPKIPGTSGNPATYTVTVTDPYNITYDANGGSGAPDAQQKSEKININLSAAKPTRDGYVFKEWNTAQDGSGISYAPGAAYTADGDATLYAQWLEIVASGSCGTSVTYSLTSDGVLTISGTGAMADYATSNAQPWKNNRTSITSIVVGENVTHIGNNTFTSCTNATSVLLPTTLTSIGRNAFLGCNNASLTSISIPASVTSIGNYAFKDCSNLATVNIGSGVTSIGSQAFAGCTSLGTVTIPNSVTSIDYDAFKGCSSLATVTLNSNPFIGEDAFPAGATVTMNLTANAAGGAYWLTFYNENHNFEADANTQIFKAALTGTKLELTELTTDQTVTKDKPVILKSTASTITMTLTSTASGNDFDGNSLEGVWDPEGQPGTAGNIFVLNNGTGGVGFYRLATGKTLGVGKAYLTYSSGAPAPAPEFLGFDDVTAIRGIENGQLTIDNYYDLQGRRVAQPTKGLYIVNGKKVVIK